MKGLKQQGINSKTNLLLLNKDDYKTLCLDLIPVRTDRRESPISL